LVDRQKLFMVPYLYNIYLREKRSCMSFAAKGRVALTCADRLYNGPAVAEILRYTGLEHP
jgi:hypothetical protein